MGIHLKLTRDLVLFILGCGIIIQQTIVGGSSTERPYLLGLAAMMVGLPVFLNLDAVAKVKKDKDEEDDDG